VTYSGTVTAAMEASINGKLGVAVSLDAPEHYDGELNFASAAKAAVEVIQGLLADTFVKIQQPIWNINLPYREDGQYKGVLYTRQGVRLYRDALEKRLDPRGKPYYWIGGEAPTGLMDEGTDYWAIKQGYISVTPLQMDMTNKSLLEILNRPMG